jgi:phosphate-selective porin OprO/OprP
MRKAHRTGISIPLAAVAGLLLWAATGIAQQDENAADDTASVTRETSDVTEQAAEPTLIPAVDLSTDISTPSELELAGFSVPHVLPACPAKPKYPTARLTGFFQADAGLFSQNNANMIAVGDIPDGADFRRARLAAVGNVADNVAYSAEFDFAFPGRPSLMDVWLELRNLSALQNLKIGFFRQPFGLDGLTSVKELTFIERALPFAFLPFRQIGAMAHGTNAAEDITWAVSGFRFPTDFFGGQIGDDGGYGLATRLTGVLIDNGDQCVLHAGGAYSVIDPANDRVRYLSPPEFFIAETGGAAFVPDTGLTFVPPFVDTGPIPTDVVNLFEADLAATSGPFHGQAEVIYAVVSRPRGSAVGFSGVSTQAAWILTGEHRPYNRKSGVLGRVVPAHPFGDRSRGAWEVAARWSYLDLNDAEVRGGRLNDVTLGLNWYLNQFTKFQFNYIRASLVSPVNGASDASILAARAQVDF